MKYLMLVFLTACVLLCAASAQQASIDKVPFRHLLLLTGNETPPSAIIGNTGIGLTAPPGTDQQVGEIDTVGTTWYDFQHNGTAGRMIKYDDAGRIHVCWMNGLDNGATIRHVFYNLKDTTSQWLWTNVGTAVEASPRGGYTCLDVDADGYPFVAFHATVGAITRAAVAIDFFPGTGAFQYWPCPDVNNREIIWPRITVDLQGRCHLINTEDDGTEASSPLWYCRGVYDPILFNLTYSNYEQVTAVETISADITASRHSNRVAFAYAHPQPTLQGDTVQYNNDIYLYLSEDGITWDWDHPLDVTGFLQPDTTLLPDTIAAMMDTLRAYTDASIIFDENDDVHIAFTTPYYDGINGLISINNSLIWHWSEELGWNPSLVADGWWGAVAFQCGAWQRFIQRPCLAIDTTSGDLFITYQYCDTSDVAANGYPQGEVYVSRSTDNGHHWSVGVDVTNTHAPGAAADSCWSERDITCSETVENGALHLLYILDRDAGSVLNSEGTWTLNPVYYHRVPIDSIPTTPLMPSYPFHVPVIEEPYAKIPTTFHLAQNYPNPFNPSTTIRFDLNRPDIVTLKVYNILGREVGTLVDGHLQAGTYKVHFDAPDLASGVYFYRLSTPSQTLTRKMVLIK